MKRNKLLIAGIVTAFVALISLSLVSGTWAKYTSNMTGSDTAKVAKWAFDYKGTALNLTSDEITFDLFETVLDTDGAAETDVAANLIAPGTKGEFEFQFTNKSEVTAEYTVEFEITNSNNIPVQFSVDGGTTWTATIADITEELAIGATSTAKKVQWRWAFDGNDATDTTLGINGTAEITVEATVTFTQID